VVKRFVLAWVVTALAATGAAVAVLGLLGGALAGTPGHVLSQGEVRAALATATAFPVSQAPPSASPPASPSAPASPSPLPSRSTSPSDDSGATKLVRTAGGTVIASCAGGEVTLRSWSPAQGYAVDDVDPGPRHDAKVKFRPADGDDVEVRIVCSAGRPSAIPH
jgi:serine/threonine-protein kinase